jgi:hypothetical protein
VDVLKWPELLKEITRRWMGADPQTGELPPMGLSIKAVLVLGVGDEEASGGEEGGVLRSEARALAVVPMEGGL